jgi:hypothetical protein
MRRCSIVALVLFALSLLGAMSSRLAEAQDKPGASADKPAADKPASDKRSNNEARAARRATARAKQAAARAAKKGKRSRRGQEPAESEATAPPSKDAAEMNPDAAALSQDNVRKEGDIEVKTLEFSGLDIEGELKTPQLLYFMTRLRAEFGRPRLPHRSFMPELARSTGEKPLR